MTMDPLDKLVAMVNQIARNLAHDDDPAGATAAHIATYWSPRMRAQIAACEGEGLTKVARDAIARLGVRHAD